MKKLQALLLALLVVAGCQKQMRLGPVAFSRLTGDYWQLWTIHPDGKGARQLTTSPSDKRYPEWSKDGQKLFFRDNNNQAFLLDLATGQEGPILRRLGMIGSIAESPISDDLLVVRYRTEMKDSCDLWLTSRDGEDLRILTRDVGLQYDPAWSPDGKEIAYISGQVFQDYELFVMDADGKNKRRLTNNRALELLPAFSPDGGRIAYASDVTGDYEIWLVDRDGSNSRRITEYDGIDTRPCWSPDESRILFVSNRSSELQLWIINSDGSKPRQLTSGAPSMEPTWRKDPIK